jgi:alpha-L-rhamnosidase
MACLTLKLCATMAIAVIALLTSLATMAKAEPPCSPTGLRCDLLEHPEQTVINTAVPEFGWIYNSTVAGDAQSGYRITVVWLKSLAINGTSNVWDSGLVHSASSINVPYGGKALQPDADYYWQVQTMDGSGQTSPFSHIQHFRTDTKLIGPLAMLAGDLAGSSGLYYHASQNIWANRYPLHFEGAAPVLITNTAPGRWFVDFGQDAFGYVMLNASGSGKVEARFGEMADGLAVKTNPPVHCLVRYTNVEFTLPGQEVNYPLRPPAFPLPSFAVGRAINPPPNYGVVMPFRYFELINFPGTLAASNVTQERLLDEFDTNAASFDSSSPALNQIWNLCRNSMQVLTFDGVYVDGDRERTPYESDSYIHQLSSYGVDGEFILARYSFEYLLQHPTWPTEWKFHMIFIAWADYLQTGNTNLLNRYYDRLKPDLLAWAATGNGLLKGFPDFPHKADNSDVVDWPVTDRDGFVIRDGKYLNWTNSVNNAFYYRSLQIMAQMATTLGRTNDAANYTAMAAQVYQAYNDTFWNSDSQSYVDGVGTTHSSTHANFFPLAFGLVPAERQATVINFLHGRIAANDGMPPSVYGAQYLMEALFNSGDADTALDLMTTNGPRGWLNMINMGSTISTEAWNFSDKPNLDWNHAWGAAPGNLIPRFILGVRPITPGYGQILIQPRLGRTLSFVRGTIPTIRGAVSVEVTNTPDLYEVTVDIPGNVTATVVLPAFKLPAVTLPASAQIRVPARVDGKRVWGTLSDGWLSVPDIGSGRHTISLDAKKSAPLLTAFSGNHS